MINIESLKFKYQSTGFSLNIPQLSISSSEKIAIIGPSGSGKTTLLKLICGIIAPHCGTVSIDNYEINKQSDAARREFRITNIGFIFQDFELLDYLNVQDNILHPYRITEALKLNSMTKKRAQSLAQEMGIDNKLTCYTDNLSQGERQRTAICRALLSQPKLLLADEATGNLDPDNKTRILDALFHSVDKHNATLIAVTHDHELLSRFDRVVEFSDYCHSYSS